MGLTQVDIKPTDGATVEDPAYIAEMVAKAEGKDAPTTTDLLAGKYTSEEELDKAILELAKKKYADPKARAEFYKSMEADSQPAKVEEPAKVEDQPPKIEDPPKDVDGDIDIVAIQEEYTTNGSLSEATYEMLAKRGLSKAIVDDYIEARTAKATLWTQDVFKLSGGEPAYTAMTKWAAVNFTPEEKATFNSAIQSFNPTEAQKAIEGLTLRYQAANGRVGDTPLIEGQGTGRSHVAGYRSRQEMTADMKDPRYNKDPAWREMVKQKLKYSKEI